MKRRCKHCGVAYASLNSAQIAGCIRGNDIEGRAVCQSTKIDLLEMALRRNLVPDAFDDRLRIKPGRLPEVLDAEREALVQAAALFAPVDHDALSERIQTISADPPEPSA